MRQKEVELEKLTGYRCKVVERGGVMIQRLLTKSNSWEGVDCGRGKCLVCATNQNTGKKQSCVSRNILYKTTCLECVKKGEDSIYYGESHRSGFERGREHVRDYKGYVHSQID